MSQAFYIWGASQHNRNSADLATWIGQRIRIVDDAEGFPYADVLAGTEGCELRRVLSTGFTGSGLSKAMRSLSQSAGPGRITNFYQRQSGARKSNVAAAFTSFCTNGFTNRAWSVC